MSLFTDVTRVRGALRSSAWWPPRKPRRQCNKISESNKNLKKEVASTIDCRNASILKLKYKFREADENKWRKAVADFKVLLEESKAGLHCNVALISILMSYNKPYIASRFTEKLVNDYNDGILYSNPFIIGLLINVYSRQDDLFQCKCVFSKFLKLNLSKPDAALYVCFINACAQNKDLHAARQAFEQVIQEQRFSGKPLSLWNAGIQTRISVDEVKVLICKMKKVDSYTLTELLKLCRKLKNVSAAEEFLSDPTLKRFFKPDIHENAFLSVIESVSFEDLYERYLQLKNQNSLSYFPCYILIRGVLNAIESSQSDSCVELRETYLPKAESAFYYVIDNEINNYKNFRLWLMMFKIYSKLDVEKLPQLVVLANKQEIPLTSPTLVPYLPTAVVLR